ncbi:TPA: LysR family transcriptional regulator [Pseudomonas aeruginosa]
MDKLNALAMFVATAETGSFSRGAERLGKTPSALTKAVAHLEAELGARLFERTTRSLALTEAGQIYLEAARQSLETLRTAGQEIELLESELRGELRLAAPPSFAAAFLQQACASFLEAHPRISLRVDLDETFLDLSEGGYDIGLRDGPIDLPGLVARPLAPNQIVLCASPAYLARQPAPQGPEDFERHAWLVFQHPSLNQNFWWMERDGARQRIDQPRPRLASDNYDFLLAHLLAGLGLQFCPQWSVAPLLGEGRLVRLLGDYHFDPGPFGPSIHVLYPGHRRNTRKVRAFLEHLRASLQRQGLCHRL